MFEETLLKGTKDNLALLGRSGILQKDYLAVNIADLRDIAAMKIDAVSARGAKRDFIDLFYISKEGFTLEELLAIYDNKYGTLSSNLVHIQKSLVYFDDAEIDEMPKMIKKANWVQIKNYFQNEVKKLANG